MLEEGTIQTKGQEDQGREKRRSKNGAITVKFTGVKSKKGLIEDTFKGLNSRTYCGRKW